MAGPAAALIPVDSSVQAGLKALTGDLVTFRGQIFRKVEHDVGGKKQAFLAPVDVEAHINPLGILLGGGVAALGVLALTIAWHGLNIPAPLGGAIELVPGIKDTSLGKDLSESYERWKLKRELKRQGAEIVESRTGLSQEEKDRILAEQIGDAECQLLSREWAKAKRRGDLDAAANFLKMAREKGCPWVNHI